MADFNEAVVVSLIAASISVCDILRDDACDELSSLMCVKSGLTLESLWLELIADSDMFSFGSDLLLSIMGRRVVSLNPSKYSSDPMEDPDLDSCSLIADWKSSIWSVDLVVAAAMLVATPLCLRFAAVGIQ